MTSRSCRTASDLPIEWVAQILSFLSLAQRFICKSVSRKWLLAANQSLSDQDEVTFTLTKFPDNRNKTNVLYLNVHLFTVLPILPLYDLLLLLWTGEHPRSLAERIRVMHLTKSLSCFKNLKTIRIVTGDESNHKPYLCDLERKYCWSTVMEILKPVVLYNSPSLVRFSIENSELFHKEDQTSFPRLKELTCDHLTEHHVSSFKRLQKITVLSGVCLHNLPANTMQELRIRFHARTSESVSSKYILQAISRLTNLRVIRIEAPNHSDNTGDQITSTCISHAFQNHTKLEEVCLGIHFGDLHIRAGTFLPQILQNNPNLRKISFSHKNSDIHDVIHVDDKTIHSFAKKKNLQSITINYNDSDPIKALLTLLRGRLRNSIQELVFKCTDNGLKFEPHHVPELETMQQETGFEYRLRVSDRWDVLFIHHVVTITRSDAEL